MQNDLQEISRRIGQRLRAAHLLAKKVNEARKPCTKSCKCGACKARLYPRNREGTISVQAWTGSVSGEERFFGVRLARNPEEAAKFAAEWTGKCKCMRH